MVFSNQDIINQIERIKTAIKDKINNAIANHYSITGSSSKTGHVQAGGVPSNISNSSASAGDDDGKYARANHVHKVDTASTSQYGVTKLSNAVDSESKVLAATPYAVKQAYDLAVTANGSASSGRSDNNFSDECKEKLQNIEPQATKVIVDNALNSNSSNPVQNKIIVNALNGKVNTASGMGLSHNDYTDTDKTAVGTIPTYLLKEKVINNFNTTTFSGSDPTALSAYQGRVLNEGKFNKTGGEISGDVSLIGTSGKITAKKFVVANGQSNQFLKADGSLDNGSYVKSSALSAVATSGSYTDLSNKPSLSTVATSGNYTDLSNKPSLSTVATSGSYKDLSNKPTYSATVTTSTSGYYKIGDITLDGTNKTTLYGKDTNTTYSNGDGLLLSNNNVFSANFGTGNKQVARGDHTHPGLTEWEKHQYGHVTVFYNQDLELVYLKIFQEWGSVFSASTYRLNYWETFVDPADQPNYSFLSTYAPKGSLSFPVTIFGSGNSVKMESYMTSTGKILMKSSERGTFKFLINGMYPANIQLSDD